MSTDPRRSFDRIVNHPVPLPPPTRTQTYALLHEGLEGSEFFEALLQFSRSEDGVDSSVSLQLEELLLEAAGFLGTIRELNRFINALETVFGQLGSSCNPLDVFRMEMLRHAAPVGFSKVVASSDFVEARWGEVTELQTWLGGRLAEEERSARIKALVEGFDESHRSFARMNLSAIFPAARNALAVGSRIEISNSEEEYRRERRLAHPRFWERYLTIRLDVAGLETERMARALEELKAITVQDVWSSLRKHFEDLVARDRKKVGELFEYFRLWRDRVRKKPLLVAGLLRMSASVAHQLTASGRDGIIRASELDKAEAMFLALLPTLPPEAQRDEVLMAARYCVDADFLLTIGLLGATDFASMSGQPHALDGATIQELMALIVERIGQILDDNSGNIFSDGDREPLAILGRFIGLHEEPRRQDVRKKATDYLIARLTRDEKAISWLRDLTVSRRWGGVSRSNLDSIFEFSRVLAAIAENQAKFRAISNDAYQAQHQVTNWGKVR